jgi:FdhE protein
MWNCRAERARLLAERYPAAKEILTFYAGLAEWQGQITNRAATLHDLRDVFPSLIEFVAQTGPQALADAARDIDGAQFRELVSDYWESAGELTPLEFFARALMQPYAANLPAEVACPWCSRAPQAGCLTPQGEGLAFEVVCAMCLRRRPFPRTRCPGCGESSEAKLASFQAREFPHLRLQACETCKGYLLIVDLSRDPEAIPEVDELAGLPLDLWAIEHGYQKLQPNLAGI